MTAPSGVQYAAALAGVEPVIDAAGKKADVLAAELFAVVDVLDHSASLRRALTDPARDTEAKVALLARLFGDLSPRGADVVGGLVAHRWSDEDDLPDALEAAGVAALLAAADASATLDAVEEELFRVERLLAAERDLRVALDDRNATPEARRSLLESVFATKVGTHAYALLARPAAAPRGRRLSTVLTEFIEAAAARRDRHVAHVTSAVELSAKQRARLAGILSKAYGREIQVNVAIEPTVLGGVRVQVGHEVVDGTMLSRLDDVRQKIGG